jgi:hypothetical protein
MPGIDPVSLGLQGLQTVGGIIQSFIGGHKERKAEKALENLQTPTYEGSKSILDYYNKALQRYNTNPYQSAQYQYGIQQGNRNTAAGINALQDRNSAIGGISRLIALQNNNALQQGITATNQQTQNFSQLGQAAQAKSADDQYGFQINKLMPYQKQLSLLSAKAAGGANMLNAGLQNIFGGVQNASNANMANQLYGASGAGVSNGVNGLGTGFVPVNLNTLNGGGLNGNGNPFATNSTSIFDYSNPYGE